MFSGIVETSEVIEKLVPRDQVLEIHLKRPKQFDDIKVGDSISVNGVCLTVEKFDQKKMQFVIGPETLNITGWKSENLLGSVVNLERSLCLGDRIHGHLVSGHVDTAAKVLNRNQEGESLFLEIELPKELKKYIWKKGSVAINGVSLTVNEVANDKISICLIPETLRVTNLGQLEVGDSVNLEVDFMARGLVNQNLDGEKH